MKQFQVGKQTIIVDDCLTHLQSMSAQSVDCVVTSPPFNIGVNYRSYADQKPRDLYLTWMKEIGQQIARVLRPDGAYFLDVGSTNVDPWIQIDVMNALRDVFILQNHIIWAKSISIHEDTFGHFKPINSKRFLNHTHESIFHFTLDGNVPIDRLAVGVPFMDKSNLARRGHQQDKRCAGNIWYLPYQTVMSKDQKYNHPASFPVALPERCLRLHGGSGVVLDPFVGTGATLVAAARLGWEGIGIEIDEQYALTAEQRLLSLQTILAIP